MCNEVKLVEVLDKFFKGGIRLYWEPNQLEYYFEDDTIKYKTKMGIIGVSDLSVAELLDRYFVIAEPTKTLWVLVLAGILLKNHLWMAGLVNVSSVRGNRWTSPKSWRIRRLVF
jgi:hypothetical protein